MGYSPDVFIKRSTKRLVTPLARIAFFDTDASNCYLFHKGVSSYTSVTLVVTTVTNLQILI